MKANKHKAHNKAKIWTIEYSPFIVGGSLNRSICTIVSVVESRKIKGFNFFSFKTPRGNIRVCEGKTGGIIADSFDELINNIDGVPKKILQEQIDGAKHYAEKAIEKSNEYFFSKYKH